MRPMVAVMALVTAGLVYLDSVGSDARPSGTVQMVYTLDSAGSVTTPSS